MEIRSFTQNAVYLITRIIWIQDSFTCSLLLNWLFRLVSQLHISTSSLCGALLCILTNLWLAGYTLVYLITITQQSFKTWKKCQSFWRFHNSFFLSRFQLNFFNSDFWNIKWNNLPILFARQNKLGWWIGL